MGLSIGEGLELSLCQPFTISRRQTFPMYKIMESFAVDPAEGYWQVHDEKHARLCLKRGLDYYKKALPLQDSASSAKCICRLTTASLLRRRGKRGGCSNAWSLVCCSSYWIMNSSLSYPKNRNDFIKASYIFSILIITLLLLLESLSNLIVIIIFLS